MKDFYDERRKNALILLSMKLKIEWNDLRLLHQALTHKSFANESKILSPHNERLEFLGDAVLDLVISEYLFSHYPEMTEGQLTKTRARLVCEQSLANLAGKLNIGKYLLLGRGEIHSGGRNRISILADALEAIIGAIYMDNGLQESARFVLSQMTDELSHVEHGEYVKDYKTMLQEYVQKQSGDGKVAYTVTQEHGPDHNKTFEVAVVIDEKVMGRGKGRTKKQAEQQAAYEALVVYNIITNENQRP